MKRIHHHPCQRCGKKAECPGEWEQNYDGFPEVICPEFHQNAGINPDFICEDCEAQPDEPETGEAAA